MSESHSESQSASKSLENSRTNSAIGWRSQSRSRSESRLRSRSQSRIASQSRSRSRSQSRSRSRAAIVQNTCNTCEPALSNTIQVTFAGFLGYWATFNGTHDFVWSAGCDWLCTDFGILTEELKYEYGSWKINLIAAASCKVRWAAVAGNPCAPWTAINSMDWTTCYSGDAPCDGSECGTSPKATATVVNPA